MASAAQIAANRRNALRSTGPRTAAGKARSCLNARKHGLYARDQSPSAEDAEQIDRLAECYRWRLQPQDAIEESLIRRLALTQFQLSRISILEAALLNSAIAKARGRYEDLPLAIGQALIDCCGSLEKLSRYESEAWPATSATPSKPSSRGTAGARLPANRKVTERTQSTPSPRALNR